MQKAVNRRANDGKSEGNRPSFAARFAVNGNATCRQWKCDMLPMEYKGALDMERPATDGMAKGGRLHRSLPPLSRPVNSSLFTFHSSLKEYRILHSPLFTLHSKSIGFFTLRSSLFTQRVSDSSLFVLHSSLKVFSLFTQRAFTSSRRWTRGSCRSG